MIKLVMFDLDGTLLDNEEFTMSSKIIEGKKIGYNLTEDIIKKTIGMSSKLSKKYFQSIYGEDFPYEYFRQKRFDYIFESVRNQGLRLKKGAQEIISFCKENNIKIALCTSSPSKYIIEYQKYTNFFEQFDLIITGDMIKNGKPDKEIFQKAIDFFNVNSNESLVVEDSINGIKAGINANSNVIMVPDLIEPNEEIIQMNVKVLNSLNDVIEYIYKINWR